jgi:hypothetical protein
VQFKGSFCSFDSNAIWKAQAEGKHKLFAWLLKYSLLTVLLPETGRAV